MADISSQLASLGSAYNNAMASGDTATAASLHQTANQLRSQNGQSTYYDSNTDPTPSSTSSGSSDPGTGTTGTTSGGGSIAGQMLNAAQNPQTTHWNFGNGQTLNTTVGDKTASYNGRSITSMSNLASTLGINYTKDPNTGALKVNGQIVNPVGYDSTGAPIVQVRQVLNAAGVPDENIKYDANTGNVSVTMPQEQQAPYPQAPYPQVPYMQPMQLPSYSSMVGAQPQMSQYINPTPYQAPDLSMYLNNLTPTNLSPFTPDWNTYMQQAHNVYDPTANQSIQQLMTKENQDITSSDEKMNARGIFNSGLAQANEDLIRGNSSNAVAKVLASSQSNIAKMAQSLYTDAFDQWSKGNSLALQNNQMWLNQAMNAEKQAYTEWLGGQNLDLNQYKAALSAWDNAASNALKYAQMQVTNQQSYDKMNQTAASDNATNAIKMYQFNNLSADQSTNLAQKQYEFNNLSADQKAQLAWDNYKFSNLSADQSATLAEKQREFNNLSADQKAQLAWKQYTFNNLSADQQATNQIQQDNLKLKMMDMMGYDTQGNPTLNRQKFDEATQYHQQLIQDSQANITNSENKTVIDALGHQLTTVDAQMKNLLAGGAKVDDPQYKALAQQSDALAQQLAGLTNKGFYGNFQGQ